MGERTTGSLAEAVVCDYTFHARRRQAQRGLSDGDIGYVLQHGTLYHKAGVATYLLRRVDIPAEDLRERERLVGTAVVTARDTGEVVTVWRNKRDGARHLRRKPDRDWASPEDAGLVADAMPWWVNASRH